MKRFLLSLLLSVSSLLWAGQAAACGYYPQGEDIRFSMLKPDYAMFPGFSSFFYSTRHFYYREEVEGDVSGKDSMAAGDWQNTALWRLRCLNEPEAEDVYAAVYGETDLSKKNSTNSFIRYLHEHSDTTAIQYLQFARTCSAYNEVVSDPWERHEYANLPSRHRLIQVAAQRIKKLEDKELIRRYAFLIIRLAYYNNEADILTSTYDTYFNNTEEGKNILDYWSLSFRALIEPAGALRNYYTAQAFRHVPDKRLMLQRQYDKSIPVNETLAHASDKEEKAAVWLLEAISNPARALDALVQLRALDTDEEALSFLLLREVTKLEDWIYTPYYTYFEPSLQEEGWYSLQNNDSTFAVLQKRIKRDRAYAREVLTFARQVTIKNKAYNNCWQVCKSYLCLMTEDYTGCMAALQLLNKPNTLDASSAESLRLIKAVCLIARQPKGKTVIPDEIKPLLIEQFDKKNEDFLFAIAKELEYKGNSTEAIFVLSRVNEGSGRWDDEYVYWKTRKMANISQIDYCYDYFDYMDIQYSPAQIQQLITTLQGTSQTDAFTAWKTKRLKQDLSLLYDLLGTKYIRKNDLVNALSAFKKVSDTLWKSEAYTSNLDANPFYANMYNEHAATEGDTITYTKKTLVQTLLSYLKKAEDPSNPDRDYYYFLVANCYLNMTQHGNSWMMRRYYLNSRGDHEHPDDRDEFYSAGLAQSYYLKAKAASKSNAFAALCLRMAGRCEKHRLIFRFNCQNRYAFYDPDSIFESNIYYAQLKEDYPDDYDELISNCMSFQEYFNERKRAGVRL